MTMTKASASEHRPHIVMILPRGEAIRNFVYSGVIDALLAHARVSLISVRPNERVWSLLKTQCETVHELRELPEHTLVTYLRELVQTAHGRWLWSVAAQQRWRTRDSEAVSARQRLKRTLKKALVRPLANRPALRALCAVERCASHWLRTSDEPLDVLRELQPSLVFNGSHVHGANTLPLIRAAERLRLPTATFLFSWDNLTSQGRLLPRYDYYFAWNERVREELLAIYPQITSNQVFVTGTPQFDFHFREEFYWSRDEFCAAVGADPRRPIVLYTSSMPRPVAGEQRIVENIGRMLRDMPDLGPPQLLVRVYPKDRTGRFEQVKRRCPDILFPSIPWEPNWLTPTPEDLYLFTNTVRHVDLGINACSTVSLELAMFGKAVINIAYNPPGLDITPFEYSRFPDYDHYRPVAKSGAVRLAYDESEMPGAIRESLQYPEAARPQQRALLQQMFGDALGNAAPRVAAALLNLVGISCATDRIERRPTWRRSTGEIIDGPLDCAPQIATSLIT